MTIIYELTKWAGVSDAKIMVSVIACAAVGLGLLSSTAIFPHVNAQSGNNMAYNDVPSAIKGKWTMLVEQANQEVKQKIDGHPGWIGIISVGNGKVSIDYVGPAATNPYHYKGWSFAPNTR